MRRSHHSPFSQFAVPTAVFIIVGLSCDRSVEPPTPQRVDLTLDNATTTEVWLKLAFPDSPSGGDFRLLRDGNAAAQGQFTRGDTTLVDDGLTAGRSYAYLASKLERGTVVGSSSPLQVKTMDSTSHNFTWQTFALGDGGSGVIYDVAIVNDTLVYAVGDIHKIDSEGQWQLYNVARWNGSTWQLISLKYNCGLYFPNCSPESLAYAPGSAVFAIAPNDVWVAAGSAQHFNGVEWTREVGFLGVGNAHRIWGSSSGELWFVGNEGFIAHRNSDGNWRKIENGNPNSIWDIWGHSDSLGGQPTILSLRENSRQPQETKLFQIRGTTLTSLSDSGLSSYLNGLWFMGRLRYYMVGERLYFKNSLSESRWRSYPSGVPIGSGLHGIRGSALNNVFVVGGFWEIAHYNGSTWYNYKNELPRRYGTLVRVATNGNLVAAGGWIDLSAAVVIGRR